MIRLAQSSIGWDAKKNLGNDPARYPTALPAILPVLGGMGWEGVEINAHHLDGLDDAGLRALRRQLDALGMQVPLLSPYTKFTNSGKHAEESLQIVRRCQAQARILGATGIRIFTGGQRSADATPEQWQRCADCLRTLCNEAPEIALCLHNHDWNLVDTVEGSLRILALVDRPNCKLLFKPAYFMPAERAALEALATHIAAVQVTQGADGQDLASSPIDWSTQMQAFVRRRQPVWFSFTCLGNGARDAGEAALPHLRACRARVA